MPKTTQSSPRAAELMRLRQRHAAAQGRIRFLQAKYDAAQTTDTNARLWTNADGLAASSANAPAVRRTLRNRTRYEVANNSFAKGIVWTIAGDTVGTGPTLHMMTGNKPLDSFIESEFALWARVIRHAEKLRILRASRPTDGEQFAVIVSNPGLDHPVKLDIQLFEPEQFADPTGGLTNGFNADPAWDDGIHYDTYGNPLTYRKLRQHPGYVGTFTSAAYPFDYDDVPARYVWHYQKIERSGQRRAIPELTPAVQLFNDLRRYRAAVLAAAETAARIAALIHTNAPADDDDTTGAGATSPEAMDVFNLPHSGGLVLPEGYNATQMKAEQPVTTYDVFTRAILAEIARCLNVPYTIAALDSSTANMSARYMDAEFYVRDRKIDRADFDCFDDLLFDFWITEARLIPGYLPADADAYPHAWNWPALAKHADPDKVASAAIQRLKSGLSTLPQEWAEEGKVGERQLELGAKALGLTVPEYQKYLLFGIFATADPTAVAQGGAANTPKPGAAA
jgi:capsid protein